MRTDQPFLDQYRAILTAVEPGVVPTRAAEVHTLAATELCLHFLAMYLPSAVVDDVPSLLLGYPALLGAAGETDAATRAGALAALRHICGAFASAPAWEDARHQHPRWPETLRCYELGADGRTRLRLAAPSRVCELFTRTLTSAVPWQNRTVNPATPGEWLVHLRRGGPTVLGYQVPEVPTTGMTPVRHILRARGTHQPLTISFDQMLTAAAKVDIREAEASWPISLPPLRLTERLHKLRVREFKAGFFQNDVFTLQGAAHLVGMLSSGKSTLVWGLLFGLTLDRADGPRIALLVSDTLQGAGYASRLRRHGVGATVLSSFHNREEHLRNLHWQQGSSSVGMSLERVGEWTESFSVACPLDGSQVEPKIIRGRIDHTGPAPVPTFSEKPCHKLYPLRRSQPEESTEEEVEDPALDERSAHSCPLWAACPAQAQQREAVEAQVICLTPQAFVHMQADRWTLDRAMTMPELFQFTMDLVLVDEVDGVQKSLDEIFAPREPIMGAERSHYAPAIGVRTFEALRERSGSQFRREINAKWQAHFFTLCRLIGVLYGLLQNETASLRMFYAEKPFTAASVLYEIWRRNRAPEREKGVEIQLDDPQVEKDFLAVMRVASSLSESGSVIESSDGVDAARDPLFERAGKTFRDLGDRLLATDGYYEELLPEFERALDEGMAVFGAASVSIPSNDRRTNALALMLAVVTGLTLSRYGWLTRAQPSVAQDFGLNDPTLFSRTGGLLRNYRTLLPTNPAGGIFGLFYDALPTDGLDARGGTLTIINHLGVGRHLLTHLHDLLVAEGQAGPHVLMLSGTSWAGGGKRATVAGHPKVDAASPSYDVQVPVCGVLLQPEAELAAIEQSQFTLVRITDQSGEQARVSGLPERERRESLATIAGQLGRRRGDGNWFTQQWARLETRWSPQAIADRRRVLLVVNSYADAAIVADALAETLDGHGFPDWRVSCLVRDQGDDPSQVGRVHGATGPRRAKKLPRSLVERFGQEPERSVLVAPMALVSRGHNILNAGKCAAISTVLFLHRPHPRPDDLAPLIGRLNRYAEDRFVRGMDHVPDETEEKVSVRARRLRLEARRIVRDGLAMRQSYGELPTEAKAQFAWDLLTPLWQTIGRGIRGGSPVFVGFVDSRFAPHSFKDGDDTSHSSVLVEIIRQLRAATDPASNPQECEVAKLLYGPFLTALSRTELLRYA